VIDYLFDITVCLVCWFVLNVISHAGKLMKLMCSMWGMKTNCKFIPKNISESNFKYISKPYKPQNAPSKPHI